MKFNLIYKIKLASTTSDGESSWFASNTQSVHENVRIISNRFDLIMSQHQIWTDIESVVGAVLTYRLAGVDAEEWTAFITPHLPMSQEVFVLFCYS